MTGSETLIGTATKFDIERHLEKVIDAWKAKLVSFDGNNKQIFYKVLKVGTVEFSDKWVNSEIIEKLIAGGKVRVSQFYPSLITKLETKEVQEIVGVDSITENDEEIEEENLNKLWAIRLRRFEAVYRRSKLDSEEKNIETCFLADGFATWSMKTAGGSIPNAPLIFHPMKIESVSKGNNEFSLEKSSSAVFNEALALYLQTEHGLDAELFDLASDDLNPDSTALTNLISAIQEKVQGFVVSQTRILGNFSFAQYPMVMDLERIKKQGTSHQLLSSLAGVQQSVEQMHTIGTEESIEELSVKNPILEHLIFPADSSQHEAISAIVGGKTIVIQGPPGTGKSQTIANVIAECIATKKSVLFVAEKKAAIDAVSERLGAVGLGEVILDLHGEPDKKTIAKMLTAVLKAYANTKEPHNSEVDKLFRTKVLLQKRWSWLNTTSEVVDAQGASYSIYDLFRLVGLKGMSLDTKILDADQAYVPEIEKITTLIRDEISAQIDVLYRCDFFEERQQHASTRDLVEQLTSPEIATHFITLISGLFNQLQMREAKVAPDIARILLPGTGNSIQEIFETLSTFISSSRIIDKWKMDRYSEILNLKSLVGPFKEYRRNRGLGLISGFFARKRELKTLAEVRNDQLDSYAPNSFMVDIETLERVVDTWQQKGGQLIAFSENRKNAETSHSLFEQIHINSVQISGYGLNENILLGDLIEIRKFVEIIYRDSAYLRDVPHLYAARKYLLENKLFGVIEFLRVERIPQSSASSYWEYLWFSSHLRRILMSTSEPSLNSSALNDAITDFRIRDDAEFRANPGRIIRSIKRTLLNSSGSGFDLLTKQSLLHSGHMPFRELLQKATAEILSIKPCFAMSPRAVSRMLPCKEGLFDVVIFDEASQIKPENAITSIYRGKQLVVAGDRHQLPPTQFGFSQNDGNLPIQLEDMESILDSVTSLFPAQNNRGNVKPLTRHYRSNDERLISWSNYYIYRAAGEELASFPSTKSDPALVLRHTYIPGVRLADMSHPNEVEIDEVIKAVKDHARNHFNQSLGIIGFGSRHSVRLQDAFNILEKTDQTFYEWKLHWNQHREKFFIKNIENVQGDERDSIIITPGYAPNLEGNLHLRFGWLNLPGGERRLNVAASRSKDSMHLITSLRSSEFDLTRSSSRGVALFKSFIEFMERTGHLDELPEGFKVPESPFEEQILKALTEKGLLVDCQVGESRFKIDFGVRDPKTNKYVLAIEADGYTYHSSAYARERDWLRQQILERKGWTFVRIWSTDWWENPNFQIKRVVDAYERAIRELDTMPVRNEIVGNTLQSATTNEMSGNDEFEFLRGIMAQFPYTPKEKLLEKWMDFLGLKRKTGPLKERFESYYLRAKKDIRAAGM